MSHSALQLPGWMLFVRIAQGVLAIITLGLTAFAATVWGTFSGFALNWFVCLWTFAFLAFTIVVRPRLTQSWANNHIVPLIPELVTAFWWLVSFALLANEASALNSLQDVYNSIVEGDTNYNYAYTFGTRGNAALGCTKGAAAAGAIEFLTFLATIGIYIATMLRTRRTGNTNFNHIGNPNQTTGGYPKAEANQNSQPQYPQQSYTQPQQYPQAPNQYTV